MLTAHTEALPTNNLNQLSSNDNQLNNSIVISTGNDFKLGNIPSTLSPGTTQSPSSTQLKTQPNLDHNFIRPVQHQKRKRL